MVWFCSNTSVAGVGCTSNGYGTTYKYEVLRSIYFCTFDSCFGCGVLTSCRQCGGGGGEQNPCGLFRGSPAARCRALYAGVPVNSRRGILRATGVRPATSDCLSGGRSEVFGCSNGLLFATKRRTVAAVVVRTVHPNIRTPFDRSGLYRILATALVGSPTPTSVASDLLPP